jgi:Tol biopolymer transport system component
MLIRHPTLQGIFLLLAFASGLNCVEAPATGPTPPDPPPAAPLYDRIIFARISPGSCAITCLSLWTMTPSGTDLRLLRDSLHWPQNPSVAPDGRRIVFEDWGLLYLMDAAGRNLLPLQTGREKNIFPSWTPDGSWVLFMAAESIGGPWQVYRVRPDGTGRQQLTTDPQLAAWHPTLSRDGRFLAYRANSINPPSRSWLVIRDLQTGSDRVVTDSTFHGGAGHWSPDGTGLLFLDSDPNFPPGFSLWQLTLTTGVYSYFGNSRGNRPATYSPDGRTLLYGTGDLWLADSNGQNPRVVLADSATNFEAYWTPASPAP